VLPLPARRRRAATRISLIQVPYHAGDDRHAASGGPPRLVEAGATAALTAQGHGVSVEIADRGGPFRDTASSSAAVNRDVAAKVRAALAADRLPLVLAGSCVTSHGVLAGFDRAECGVVWLDAHADFNTPETSRSGFFPGMSLAVLAGHCYGGYREQIGDSAPVVEEAIAVFGVRDVSPEAERDRLEGSAVEVVEWRDGKPERDPLAALDTLATRVSDVYLHVDFDGFAPEVAPGIADEPVPGGLSAEDAEAIIHATADRFRLRAATLATYAPALDRDEETLRLGLRLIELIGERAGRARDGARERR
jgi:arginase